MDDSELLAMMRHDEHHWWYRGRRQVLRAVLAREVPDRDLRLLDAGCGSGRTLDELARLGCVSGVDVSPEAVARARARGHRDVRAGAVEDLPFDDDTFDIVTCLDVIEHTPDDRRSLRELLRVTRPGGLLVVTVPAHPWLWSQHDVVNRHFRRYRRADLHLAARDAGWQLDHDMYFNSLLLAPSAAFRVLRRVRGDRGGDGEDGRSDLERTPAALNRLLTVPLTAEALLVRHGRRVPFGLSLLAVLRRPTVVQRIPAPRVRRWATPDRAAVDGARGRSRATT